MQNVVQRNNFHYADTTRLSEEELIGRVAKVAVKFGWFMAKGYKPHYFQTLFHTMSTDDTLTRFRHLVAGRRGGKTLSAAWEVLFYSLFPAEFHWDAHCKDRDRSLHVWTLTKDYPTGRAAWRTFAEVCKAAGLTHGHEYKMNKGERFFEFENGSLVEFKTADDPESLRGAGLDILWMDEAAFIASEDAYLVARPALSDQEGVVITTTTPKGKNWFYEMFWSEESLQDNMQGRVEYRSIDNPYFPRSEWEYIKKTYHPLLFKQEYMAAFDSMAGVELPGDWLKYYAEADLPRTKDGKYDLSIYLGVDPAISLADTADRFAMALLGVTKDHQQVYLLKQYAGRIPFPEQVDLIREWHLKYRPSLIGIEKNAYQAALVQQVMRLENLPPVVPILSTGKKSERILAMAPLFKIGKIRIRDIHRDFVDEWLNYDSSIKNTKDDCLDSVEIALQTAGALLPAMPAIKTFDDYRPASSIEELAERQQPGRGYVKQSSSGVDEHLGFDW